MKAETVCANKMRKIVTMAPAVVRESILLPVTVIVPIKSMRKLLFEENRILGGDTQGTDAINKPLAPYSFCYIFRNLNSPLFVVGQRKVLRPIQLVYIKPVLKCCVKIIFIFLNCNQASIVSIVFFFVIIVAVITQQS